MPDYRNPDFIRGLEEFDYIWLLWLFSANGHQNTHPTVRPPLLGGNTSVGVFASRSPYRPNPIGLSSVRVEHIVLDRNLGPVIHVLGADLMDGTPIIDIKPYVEYADAHTGVRSGFVDEHEWKRLRVVVPEAMASAWDKERLQTLTDLLSLDPRPHYHDDEQRVYGMPFDAVAALVVPAILPFNIIKGLVISVLTGIVYKSISNLITPAKDQVKGR